MHVGVVALWSVLEACRAGSERDQQHAVQEACRVVRHRSSGAALVVELQGAVLAVDGIPVGSGADSFAPTHGLIRFLRDARIARVAIVPNVEAEDMLQWAQHILADREPQEWPRAIAVELRPAHGVAEANMPGRTARESVGASDSRLQSVFLQHRLIASLPAIAGVEPAIAKLVIEGVVDRLLRIDGGLEPLMLLQHDESVLRRGTAIAVLAVVFARRAGWPLAKLADLGAAGLLHDLGSMLDPDRPGPAAFRWLLQRGDDDFWLRCALCARRWRERGRARAEQQGPLAVVALIRLAAVAFDAGLPGVQCALDDGSVPRELVDVATQAIAAQVQ